MRRIVRDHYSGFEGYGEIIFVRRYGDSELAFTLWVGYFDTIMMAVPPGPTGWTSLALAWHVEEPWDLVPAWPVTDPQEVACQLDGVAREGLDQQARVVLDELIAFIREGAQAGDLLLIEAR